MKSKNVSSEASASPAGLQAGGGRASITLDDVARAAGLSKMTASRALNKPSLVTPETQRRVREAAAAVGYIPNLIAGSLKSKKTRLIACLVPTIASGSVFLVAVHAMTEAFAARGYQVMLGERGYDASREDDLVEAMCGPARPSMCPAGGGRLDTARPPVTGPRDWGRVRVVSNDDVRQDSIHLFPGFQGEVLDY